MECVLDCSLALAWGLPDEVSMRADRVLARASRTSVFWVPALWWYEVSNALTMAHRRKRLTDSDRTHLVELYARLPIQTDTYLGSDIILRLSGLVEKYRLSAYDAAYLELAQRRGLVLASLDLSLNSAARRAGVEVISR